MSAVLLGWNAWAPGIATAYVDPIAKIQAQDEALYGSVSLQMAEHGDWLTPKFLDRYELVKPPLLYWLEASWMKVIGPRVLAMRLPSILAGAATIVLVFWWLLDQGASLAAAAAAALLLLSSHLFFVLSRIGLTDALLTFTTSLAVLTLARDPRLASRSSLWTFGLASGAAIMTKGIAGLFSLLALALVCVISRERPGWRTLAQAVGISAMVAAPWHLYELWRHTRWFWAQYVLDEIVGSTTASPIQSTQESHVAYYLKRLVLLDAPLLAGALAALARKRPRVLLAWIVIVLAAAMKFDYRNTTYLLPILPALAVLVGLAIPRNRAVWALALTAMLFAGKAVAHTEPWGLPFGTEAPMPQEAVLDRYAGLKRGNDLIVGDPNDQFYSACLDLPRVRYLYLDPSTQRPHSALDFEYLGVTMTASDFGRLNEVRPMFEQRLRDWGLNSGASIATVILAPTMDQIDSLIRDHPDADFFLPIPWAAHDAGVHQVQETADGREVLLARKMIQRP